MMIPFKASQKCRTLDEWQTEVVDELEARKNQRQKILKLLQDGQPHNTKEISLIACQYNARIKELREKGHIIVATKDGRVWWYELKTELEDNKMSEEEQKKEPIQKFKAGGVHAAIWVNSKDDKKWLSVSFQRVYKDGDEYKTVHSYNEGDLPKLRLVLEKCYEWLLTNSTSSTQ